MGRDQHLALDIVYEATSSCMTSSSAPSVDVVIHKARSAESEG